VKRLHIPTLVLALAWLPSVLNAQMVPGAQVSSGAATSFRFQLVPPPPGLTGHQRTRALEGALVGFVVGATVITIVTRSGGSNSLCDRSRNQDALSSGECLGLAAAGGLAGAGLGALVGSRIRVSALHALPARRLGAPAVHGQLVIAAVHIGLPPD
jgi:hypothetical protein